MRETKARHRPVLPGTAFGTRASWVRPHDKTRMRHRTRQGWIDAAVIYVTRLDGSQLVVNADLIETVEHTADTVITLSDGKKLVVGTPVSEVVDRIIAYRQAIARGPLKTYEHPPIMSLVEPTPIRPREGK